MGRFGKGKFELWRIMENVLGEVLYVGRDGRGKDNGVRVVREEFENVDNVMIKWDMEDRVWLMENEIGEG